MKKLAGLVALTALGAVAGWVAATWRCPDHETDFDYWSAFADGELHQQLNDRTPSLN